MSDRSAISRRTFAVALGGSVVLAACGAGDAESDDAELRLINATTDIDSVDVTYDGDDIDEEALFTAVARDAQSGYTDVEAGDYQLRLRRSGSGSTLVVASTTAEEGRRHTLVASGRVGDLRIATLSDEEDEASEDRALIRVYNTAADTGSVDVYLTDADTPLSAVEPTIAGVAGEEVGDWVDVEAGTYRVRVTGADDKDDLRLDATGVVFGEEKNLTLILQAGSGGVLVHALLSEQQRGLVVLRNAQARVRLVAGVADNQPVSAEVGTTSLNVNLRSPSVGNYTLVAAGTRAVSVRVAGVAVAAADATLDGGGDYTLLVHGTAAAPRVTLLADDNRLPANEAKAKFRLVHGLADVDAELTLAVDFVAAASGVARGTASAPAEVTVSAEARIEVTSPLSATPLFEDAEAQIVAQGVYTVFMLGGGSAAQGVLRRER